MKKTLIVSENANIKIEIRKNLTDEDYLITEYQNDASGQELLYRIDLIIFDLVDHESGITAFLSQLKYQYPSTPIIAIVEQGNVEAAVDIMHAGAAHVLTYPLNKESLLTSIRGVISQPMDWQQDQVVIQQAIDLLQSLRIKHASLNEAIVKHQLERSSPNTSQDGEIRLGDLTINTRQGKVFYRKVIIDLTHTQFQILSLLGEAKGRVVPFEEVYFHLHSIHLGRSSARIALSAHLSNLRSKLTSAGCSGYLVNIRGRGYMLENPDERNINAINVNMDLILEQLPIILWTTNSEFHINSIVGAGINNLGMEASKIIGSSLANFMQIENANKITDAHRQALLGNSSSFEHVWQDRVFQIYIEPSFNKDDRITGCIGLALDVTERKQAEEAYQILVDHSQQGLAIFQNNRIVFANEALTEITGYSSEELLSLDDFGALIVVDDRPKLYENTRNRLAGEIVSPHSEYRIIRKDSSIIWLEQTTFTTNFRGQKALHTAVTDRTEHKRVLEARRQIEDMYRALAKNLPNMAVLLFDHDLRYIIAEGQALEEMGYFRDNMEGKTIWEVLSLDRAEALIPYYHAALNGDIHSFDWNSNGRYYEVQTLPIKHSDGEVIAGMFIIQDVTRHKVVGYK